MDLTRIDARLLSRPGETHTRDLPADSLEDSARYRFARLRDQRVRAGAYASDDG